MRCLTVFTALTGFDRRAQNEILEAVLGDRLAPAATDDDDQENPDPPKAAQPFIMTPEELQAYAGMHYSPELETVYTFSVEGGRLMASHRRYDPFEVALITRDEFEGPFFVDTIKFERDSSGRVTGMRISNGRVRNLWFDKLE
jgi:hypothetical protein